MEDMCRSTHGFGHWSSDQAIKEDWDSRAAPGDRLTFACTRLPSPMAPSSEQILSNRILSQNSEMLITAPDGAV